jgi:dephospho-CoA kinase
MADVRIIGLGGTNGAGKDTVGKLLAGQYNLLFVSVSDLLREEARKRNFPVTREVLRTISAEWRREFGLGVLVDRAIEKCQTDTQKTYAGVVACPMRNPGEAQHVKDLGGLIIWVDAEPKVRYDRIQATKRGRDGEDGKTYEEFLAEEQIEMHTIGDAATLDMTAVRALADVQLQNDGDVENLQHMLEKSLKF